MLLDKECSVLASEVTQHWALLQFALPKDDHFLQTMLTLGLHLSLKGYLLKGTLVAEELFDRRAYLHEHSADGEALAKERSGREQKVVTMQVERSGEEAVWCRELGAKERTISGYTLQHTKQVALIEKLHGDVAKLRDEISRLKQEIIGWGGRISSLGAKVGAEKRRWEEAQKSAQLERLAVEGLKKDLSQEQSAHQASKAEMQDLEARFAQLDSQEYRTRVIEEYRHNSLGKAEVALTYKAGVDHLASLIPLESRPSSDRLYPPQIAWCLNFLKEMEMRGGGTLLLLDKEGDNDEAGADQEKTGPSVLPPGTAGSTTAPNRDLQSPTSDPDREC